MKKILIATLVGASLLCGQAEAGNDICPMIESVAKSAMTNRQENLSMSEMITKIEAALGADDPFAKYGVELVKAAYARPLAYSSEGKLRAILEFANQNAAICYAANSK